MKRLEEGDDRSDQWGLLVSEVREKSGVPVRSEGKWAAGLFPSLGRGVPEALLYIFPLFFFFLFFCFLVSFIEFVFLIQKTSNQLQMFSKIQGIKVVQ
jgi:hypothetical protein